MQPHVVSLGLDAAGQLELICPVAEPDASRDREMLKLALESLRAVFRRHFGVEALLLPASLAARHDVVPDVRDAFRESLV